MYRSTEERSNRPCRRLIAAPGAAGLGLITGPAGHLAGQSVIAGMNVAAHFPAPLRDAATATVQSAFVTGVHRGSLVAAATTLAAALVALVFVPARPAASEDIVLVHTDATGSVPTVTANNA